MRGAAAAGGAEGETGEEDVEPGSEGSVAAPGWTEPEAVATGAPAGASERTASAEAPREGAAGPRAARRPPEDAATAGAGRVGELLGGEEGGPPEMVEGASRTAEGAKDCAGGDGTC